MEKFICQWVKLVFSQECTSIYYLYISLLYKSIEKVKCIFSFLFSNSYTFTIVKIIR